ncbi:MAG: PDZ domain-containing protein [Pyrinomonadaceae bacterium MAG19_C2-C3]|nr:PDZ domain-containing protein [Pyrinomonadaceae bacterium MAG19_C2-C3]
MNRVLSSSHERAKRQVRLYTKRKLVRRLPSVFAVLLLLPLLTASAATQQGKLNTTYTVAVVSTQASLFHVTTEVRDLNQRFLEVSLPVWTPGWYTIENYAKNILRFKVTDANSGARVPFSLTGKQTWSIGTAGRGAIKIEFDYRADVLALNQAKISQDFAFFTGTQLFLRLAGHTSEESTVRFQVPDNWRILSALKETADQLVFTAPDYDTLVDSTTEMGNFDVETFEVAGKPHYFAATPAGAFSTEKRLKFVEMLKKVAHTQSAIFFNNQPFDKYVYFYFFMPPESNAGGALEHANSHVAFAPSGDTATPDGLIETAAHEFFHLWNVKRLRPLDMTPYDYSREQETSFLWISEGFTNYYANVTMMRAGFRSRREFLDRVARAALGVESNEARAYISPAASSISTWLGNDPPRAFEISYRTQGENLGALLDLSIRHDTNGALGLDDLMRLLYRTTYERGKGFNGVDILDALRILTRNDYKDFLNRYASGVEIPDYARIYAYAGYRFERGVIKRARLGFTARSMPEGLRVTSIALASPAEAAGLRVGDVITRIDDSDTLRLDLLDDRIGQTIALGVIRDSRQLELPLTIQSRDHITLTLIEVENPTHTQLRVREAWLKQGV